MKIYIVNNCIVLEAQSPHERLATAVGVIVPRGDVSLLRAVCDSILGNECDAVAGGDADDRAAIDAAKARAAGKSGTFRVSADRKTVAWQARQQGDRTYVPYAIPNFNADAFEWYQRTGMPKCSEPDHGDVFRCERLTGHAGVHAARGKEAVITWRDPHQPLGTCDVCGLDDVYQLGDHGVYCRGHAFLRQLPIPKETTMGSPKKLDQFIDQSSGNTYRVVLNQHNFPVVERMDGQDALGYPAWKSLGGDERHAILCLCALRVAAGVATPEESNSPVPAAEPTGEPYR